MMHRAITEHHVQATLMRAAKTLGSLKSNPVSERQKNQVAPALHVLPGITVKTLVVAWRDTGKVVRRIEVLLAHEVGFASAVGNLLDRNLAAVVDDTIQS